MVFSAPGYLPVAHWVHTDQGPADLEVPMQAGVNHPPTAQAGDDQIVSEGDAVFLDVGAKSEAVMSREELTDEEGNLTVDVGDSVEATVISTEGTIRVGHKLGRGDAAGMEALAAGVPVVARDLPVLREVYGTTVAFAETVEDITAALARQLTAPLPGMPGRALASSYTWPRAASAQPSELIDV